MECKYENIRGWCRMAKNEDEYNSVYANFRYDVIEEYVSKEQLKIFDYILKDMSDNGERYEYSYEYIEDAARSDEKMILGKKVLLFPSDGVARVVNHTGYYREYKSFIGGFAVGPSDYEKIYDDIEENEENVLRYVNARINQDMAEEFAREYVLAKKEVKKNGEAVKYSDLGEFDGNRVVWVFKNRYTVKGLVNYSINMNCANYFINKLSLFYPGVLDGEKYKLIILMFNVINGNKVLHKPTVFSGGYPLGYCSLGGYGSWGCTMVFNDKIKGLPEAITKRISLGYARHVKYLGETNMSANPKFNKPTTKMVSDKLGYISEIDVDENCSICNKYK
jgi:hypothetical protein